MNVTGTHIYSLQPASVTESGGSVELDDESALHTPITPLTSALVEQVRALAYDTTERGSKHRANAAGAVAAQGISVSAKGVAARPPAELAALPSAGWGGAGAGAGGGSKAKAPTGNPSVMGLFKKQEATSSAAATLAGTAAKAGAAVGGAGAAKPAGLSNFFGGKVAAPAPVKTSAPAPTSNFPATSDDATLLAPSTTSALPSQPPQPKRKRAAVDEDSEEDDGALDAEFSHAAFDAARDAEAEGAAEARRVAAASPASELKSGDDDADASEGGGSEAAGAGAGEGAGEAGAKKKPRAKKAPGSSSKPRKPRATAAVKASTTFIEGGTSGAGSSIGAVLAGGTKRRLVEKTTMDANGYLVTEQIWEDAEGGDDEDVGAVGAAAQGGGARPAAEEDDLLAVKKKVAAATPASAPQAAIDSKTGGKSKQSGLAGFFGAPVKK